MYIEVYVRRREKKMSQEEVAKKIGINRNTYQLKESGKYDFTMKEAKKLTEIFNCTLDELFKEEITA